MHLVDLLVVAKDDDGNVTQVELATSQSSQKYGAVAGALLGLGAPAKRARRPAPWPAPRRWPTGELYDPDEVWVLADADPAGHDGRIGMLEHRWASRCATPSWTPAEWSSSTSGSTPRTSSRYGAELARTRRRRSRTAAST